MASKNILSLEFDGHTYPEYTIPNQFKDKTLYVSTKTTLDKNGWNLDLTQRLNVNGFPIHYNDNETSPNMDRTEIGICSDLNNQTFSIVARALRIDGSGDVPKAHFKVLFEAKDDETKTYELIEAFELGSDDTNPTVFFAKATLKMQL